MRSSLRVLPFAAAVLLAAPAARAVEGFTLGLEYLYGGWSTDAQPADVRRLSGGVLPDTRSADLFLEPLRDQSHSGVGLHLGWNFKGHLAAELAAQGSFWDPLAEDMRGGAALGGLRLTYFPLEYFYPQARREWHFDLGLEAGGGYALAGGNRPTGPGTYSGVGMDGTYGTVGLVAEYIVSPALGFTLGWRNFQPGFDRFILDWNKDGLIPLTNGTTSASWNTVTMGFNVHLASRE